MQRVWMFDDPRSYGARAILHEAAKGLRALGKEVAVFHLQPDDAESHRQMREHLLNTNPDAILLANHPASLFLRQIGLNEAPCQTITWLFDDPFIMGGEPFYADEHVFTADPSFEPAARQRGAERVLFLPVAAPVGGEVQPKDAYKLPVVYVGSAGNVQTMRRQIPQDMVDYLDRIIKQKLKSPAETFEKLLQQTPLSQTQRVSLTGPLAYYLYAESNRRSRLRFLLPLAKYGLQIFGNEEWRAQLKGTALQYSYRGPIDPFYEYPQLIRSASVILNLRSLQGYTVPTQRDFWVPHYGGFLLSTDVNEKKDWEGDAMDDYFQLNAFPWSPSAATPDDLIEQVEHFLNQPQARRDWTAYAQAVIGRDHNFARRMEQLEALLRKL